MTDKVHPSLKPSPFHPLQTPNGSAVHPSVKLSPPPSQTPNRSAFPVPKSQFYNPNRQAYRRRSCCGRCCICCIWFTIVILALLFLAAIAGGVIWVLYRPQHPFFSVTTLKFTTFNLTTSSTDSTPQLDSRLDISVSARNPNTKLVFFYDPISVDVSSKGVDIGNGSFPSFVHGTMNTTTLKAYVSSGGPRDLDLESFISLRSDLKKKKKKNQLGLEILLATKVRVKMGGLKTKKVGIWVFCDGINANIPKGNSTGTAFFGSSSSSSSSDANCQFKLWIKIWDWQFFFLR